MTDEPKGPAKIDISQILEKGGESEIEEVEVVDPSAPAGPFVPPAASGAERSEEGPEKRESEEASIEDRHLRLRADFENYRRRMEREMEEHRRRAEEGLVANLLPILDNLDRALAEPDQGRDDPFREGIVMIRRQLHDILSDAGLSAIEALGQPFDPEVHEAVAREESSDLPPNTVSAEMLRGYKFHGRLLRPAMVRVSASSEPEGAPSAAPEPGGET